VSSHHRQLHAARSRRRSDKWADWGAGWNCTQRAAVGSSSRAGARLSVKASALDEFSDAEWKVIARAEIPGELAHHPTPLLHPRWPYSPDHDGQRTMRSSCLNATRNSLHGSSQRARNRPMHPIPRRRAHRAAPASVGEAAAASRQFAPVRSLSRPVAPVTATSRRPHTRVWMRSHSPNEMLPVRRCSAPQTRCDTRPRRQAYSPCAARATEHGMGPLLLRREQPARHRCSIYTTLAAPRVRTTDAEDACGVISMYGVRAWLSHQACRSLSSRGHIYMARSSPPLQVGGTTGIVIRLSACAR